MSQATQSSIFSQDTSQPIIDRADMEAYLAPGAIDGFIGVNCGDDEDRTQEEGDEQLGRYNIPVELLVDMPIVEVTKETRIIHVGKPTSGPGNEITVVTNAEPQAGTSMQVEDIPSQPRAGTSGINMGVEMVLESNTLGSVADASQSQIIVTNTTNPPVQVAAPKPTAEPKKGYNTKNRKRNPAPEVTTPPTEDDTLQKRMDILGEIAEIVKRSNARQSMSELDVWGQYIGMKVARVEEGKARDKVLVDVEQRINRALYEGPSSEE